MKSADVRTGWREVLTFVEQGGTVVIEHYNRPVAKIEPYQEPHMITDRDITDQVTQSLADNADDFNVHAIVRDIIDTHGLVSIDDIPADDYWATVQKHDTSA